MKETLAFFLGFLLIAFGSRLLYRGYQKLCGRLFPADEVSPIALWLTVCTVATVFVFLVMIYSSLLFAREIQAGSLVLAGAVVLLVEHGILLGGWHYLRELNKEQISKQVMSQKQKSELDYYRTLEEQYQRQRVLIHDIRHHLRVLRDFAAEQNFTAAEEYIDRLEQSPALQRRVHLCSNHTLDAVLCRYAELCEKRGVRFSADVREHSVDFLPPEDLTAIYGNLLENAEHAAEDGGFLELRTIPQGGTVLISIVNSCAAPPRQPAPTQDGEHGLGLRSVRAAVKRHHGELNQYYDESAKQFHTVILLDIPE